MKTLPFGFMNAAGWAKSLAHVRRLAEISLTTHIVVGSFTVPLRKGNKGGVNFVVLPNGTSVNAVGLRNGGLVYLRMKGPDMARVAHDTGKQFVVSGAWFDPKEAGQLAEAAFEAGADVYEDNCGCPNVFDGGKQKAIPSFNLELMAEADAHIVRAVGIDVVVWKKLSPYTDPEQRVKVADYLSETFVSAVVTSNTLPNVRLRGEDGQPLITAENTNGLGGMGGTQLKELALLNTEHFHELLSPQQEVIGVGGIRSGVDVRDYLRVGCAGVQVGTACFWNDNLAVLQQIGEDWLARRYAA